MIRIRDLSLPPDGDMARLVQAAARIRAGEPVVASALAAGFSDYTTFLKAFRRQYGFAPGKLRG